MTLFVNEQSGERKKAGKGQRQLLASEAIRLHATAKLDVSGTQKLSHHSQRYKVTPASLS